MQQMLEFDHESLYLIAVYWKKLFSLQLDIFLQSDLFISNNLYMNIITILLF